MRLESFTVSLKTVPVLVRLTGPNAPFRRGVRVSATLSDYEVDGALVLPSVVSAVTNRSGEAVLRLWPNARGVAASSYHIEVFGVDGEVLLDVVAVVPDGDPDVTILVESIINRAPFPAIDASQQALQAVRAAAADAIELLESVGQNPGALASISTDANNRTTRGSDGGLFTPDITSDPLAYYILAKA